MRLSIDPGLRGTGFALWSSRKWDECVLPKEAGIWTPNSGKGEEWVVRSFSIEKVFDAYLKDWEVTHVYCEWPQMFDSAMGHKVASGAVSDLGKLTFLIGALGGACALRGVEFVPVPVNEWKGQLPKEVVIKRLCRRLSCEETQYDSHMWDAVGIGLYKKGHFKHANTVS